MEVRKLVLGTVQFGIPYGINNSHAVPNQDEVNSLLLFAHKAGIRTLDTAEAYGSAHQVIGIFHALYPTSKFNIITKLPEDSIRELDQKIDYYLEILKINCIECLMFHSFDTYKTNPESKSILQNYKKRGLINSIGVSVYTNEQAEVVINDVDIDIIQMPFNLLDNSNLRGSVLALAKNKGKVIHTRSAFLQGLFFMSLKSDNPVSQALSEELKVLNSIANANNLTVSQLALSYCLANNYINNVLIGVDSIEQLKDNIANLSISISPEIINEVNKRINILNPNLLNPTLWTKL